MTDLDEEFAARDRLRGEGEREGSSVLADEILEGAARLFRERRLVYGENWRLVGDVMKALFPEGITLKTEWDHNRFHIFMLEVVKLTRYAERWEDGGHEDSQMDLSVYAAMQVQIDREARERGGER